MQNDVAAIVVIVTCTEMLQIMSLHMSFKSYIWQCNTLLLLVGIKPCSILLTDDDVNACKRVATSSRATPADKLLCKAINKRFTPKPQRRVPSGSEYSPSSNEDTSDDNGNDSDEDLSEEQHDSDGDLSDEQQQARSSGTAGKRQNFLALAVNGNMSFSTSMIHVTYADA